MDKYYSKIEDCWVHRPPLKLIVNPILRILQFYTDYPFVITSKTCFKNKIPNFIKYEFNRVKLLDKKLN